MNQPFLEEYVNEIVTSCHRRNIHAMGGMLLLYQQLIKMKILESK